MLNDELIGAYLDGELDAEKRALVEVWLSQDKGAAARLERMRGSDEHMRSALPRVRASSDDPMVKLIMERPDNVVQGAFRAANRPWAKRAAAIAAACLIGVFAGRLTASNAVLIDAGLDPEMRVGAALDRVLDTAASGGRASITGAQVQVALSMRTANGRVCRQFRLTSGDRASDAVACRDGGQWRVVVQSAAETGGSDAYQTAGAGKESPIDAAIEKLGGVVVLDPAEERALISADWRVHRAR